MLTINYQPSTSPDDATGININHLEGSDSNVNYCVKLIA